MDYEKYILKFKNGDYTDFDEFYKQTSKQVYFSALTILRDRGLAEDIMQETYVSFLSSLQSVHNSDNVLAYLCVIARNKSINKIKKDDKTLYNDEALTVQKVDFNEGNSGFEEIISLLDDSEAREIITYHIVLGFKFREIAEILGKPLGTVLWKYNRALAKLRKKADRIL
ncbi:MAG: RNA polymerase sigma factor [Clostridiales bacterium]|nr:RNA polymerase sigma factor [Clostridiales bacterium]